MHGSSSSTPAAGAAAGGYYGGGGKWPNRSRYTLDNRPKKIVVKDVSEDAKNDLHTHFAVCNDMTYGIMILKPGLSL